MTKINYQEQLYAITLEDIAAKMDDINIEESQQEKLLSDPILLRILEDKIADYIDGGEISEMITDTVEQYNHEKYETK